MNDGTLIISCYGNTKEVVENLINYAIGERLVDKGLYFEWSEKDLHFTVYCKDKQEKYNLVEYIYTWLSNKGRESVRFFNPPVSKDGVNNKITYDYITKEFR